MSVDSRDKVGPIKATRSEAGANTFENIAREWQAQRQKSLESTALDGIMMRMEKHLFPRLGVRPISKINAPELLAVLRCSQTPQSPASCGGD